MPKIIITVFFSLIIVLAGITTSYSQTVYVIDEFEITMRTGPSAENRIIALYPTATKLEVIEERGEWLLVQSPDNKQGWILKRYASENLPKKIALERLQRKFTETSEELRTLKQKLSALTKENQGLSSKFAASQTDLNKTKNEYSRLMSDSKEFLALKKKYTHNLDELKKLTVTAEALKKQNESLTSATSIKWFLSGAGVVLVSWLVGYFMGKIKRKSRSSSLYG